MTYEITLLGGFSVELNGVPTTMEGWGRRQAAALVKLLALAPGRRLHREQVIDALWPEQSLDEASPKLHKAAHFARRALDQPAGILLRDDIVSLLPHAEVDIDVVSFETAADLALRSAEPDELRAALDLCQGDLLPDDLYEEWLDTRRERVRSLRLQLLRTIGDWDGILALDATDEDANLHVMRRLAERGENHSALRHYERLERTLHRELGVAPSAAATALRNRLVAAPADQQPADELVDRDAERTVIRDLLARAARGNGRTLVLAGAPGSGKSALLRWLRSAAPVMGWRHGSGVAAAVEGAWAYAPVLEALSELCRNHPTLLDALDDNYRIELERALGAAELDWSGEGGHQRLFVAAGELLRVAAADRGVLLLLDDVHEADEASLRLIHYLARGATTERVVIVLACRTTPVSPAFERVRTSLVGRAGAIRLDVGPLSDEASAELVRRLRPEVGDDDLDRIVDVAGGSPFALIELARLRPDLAPWERSAEVAVLSALDPTTRDLLQRVAAIGAVFDTDEFVALAALPDDDAFGHLDHALDVGAIEHTGSYYRFRHGLIREALIADIAPHRRRRIHRAAADRLRELDAPAARIGHHLFEAGDPAAAAPYLVRAAERDAAVGAYRDALDQLERVIAFVEGELRARALALRADLLFAIGDATAPSAYRHALELATGDRARLLRARLARAAVIGGDVATGLAAIEAVELDGGSTDGDVLLARGLVSYLTGDFDAAWTAIEAARRRILSGDKTWQVLDLIALEGLLAHTRGDWFDRIRVELQQARESPDVALAIFDGYLCPAEYLLYGPTPFDEVISIARSLRATAQRAGALRAVAFASALAGEAALLAGDLDTAERELQDSIDQHRDIGASAGEAHSLQRLAEAFLARGDREEAMRLLQRALPLARWSALSLHLLQRIYGTMILAAGDAESARSVVDRAESALGTDDRCLFCNVMLTVPAAIASARVGDLDGARRHLAEAEASVRLWDSTSWDAAVREAHAHLAYAEGEPDRAAACFAEAAQLFAEAGQPLDAKRCTAAIGELPPLTITTR